MSKFNSKWNSNPSLPKVSEELARKIETAPICLGCKCPMVGNEIMWLRTKGGFYCCRTCHRENSETVAAGA